MYRGEPHFVMIKKAHESWCANKQPSCGWGGKVEGESRRKPGISTVSRVWKAFSVGHVYISVREILIIPFWTAQGKDKLVGVSGFIFSHLKPQPTWAGESVWGKVKAGAEQPRPQGHLKHRKTIKIYAWLTRKQQNCRGHYRHTHSIRNTHTFTAGGSGEKGHVNADKQ